MLGAMPGVGWFGMMLVKSKDANPGVGADVLLGSKNALGENGCEFDDELNEVLELEKDSVVACIGRGPGAGADGPAKDGAG